MTTTKVTFPFEVRLNRYDSEGILRNRDIVIARFAAKGDAIAYAMRRYKTTPEETLVFEVFNRGRRIYRAG